MINHAKLKIAVFQMNAIVGDLEHNAAAIVQASKKAKSDGADILITPELSLCGYPPEDLLLRDDFLEAIARAINALAAKVEIPTVVGLPLLLGDETKHLFNALVVVYRGKTLAHYVKQILPNEGVFDERRYFNSADILSKNNINSPFTINKADTPFLISFLICEDIWHDGPIDNMLSANIKSDLVITINASPFHIGKQSERIHRIHAVAQKLARPVMYINAVGGQDELVFDGGSFAINPHSQDKNTAWSLPLFYETRESLGYCFFQEGYIVSHETNPPSQKKPLKPLSPININTRDTLEQIHSALKLGLSDYVRKNGFNKVFVGLSGGIDSALVVAIAVDALGAEKVHAVMMPSPYTAAMSIEDAKKIAESLSIDYQQINIEPSYQLALKTLSPQIGHLPADITEENLQSRLRALYLMALANKHKGLVINTSNKSELATGYGTLYGDMAGGFALLKDLYKRQVYALARYINDCAVHGSPIIPWRVIERPPSAELRDNQTDQDSLPPYDILDEILYQFLECRQSIQAIAKMGFDKTTISTVLHLLKISEFKRQQAAIGVRVSRHAFGKDWRMPITQHFIQNF